MMSAIGPLRSACDPYIASDVRSFEAKVKMEFYTANVPLMRQSGHDTSRGIGKICLALQWLVSWLLEL